MFEYQNNSVSHISKVSLMVSNLDRSVKFYQDLLGLKVMSTSDEGTKLSSNGTHILTLLQATAKSTFTEGLYHIAFILPSMEALAQWYLYQNSRGFRIPGVANHLVSAAFYLNDPDGNGIEVYADTDPSTWKKQGDTIIMDTLPLDIQKLTKGISASLILDSDVRIGHLHLKARNVSIMKDFYQLLGLDLKLNMGHAVFLSYGGYHHHLGINQWNRELMSPYSIQQVGIREFEIHFPTKEELHSVMHRLEQQGITFHTQEDGIFVKDPIGISVHLTA